MNEYETYVKAVNKIFAMWEKLKNNWTNNDSLNHIEEINKYKRAVIKGANILERQREDRKKEIEC